MKPKHLLPFAVVAMTSWSVTANAQIAVGEYFIQNVESGAFLNGANSWGTKASTTKHGQKMTIAQLNDGYSIDTHISNGGAKHFLAAGDNTYTDGDAAAHTITDLGDGTFTIMDSNGNYLHDEGGFANFNTAEVTDATKWRFLSMDDMFKTLDEATAENPVDATFFVDDANFSRNNTLFSAWKGGPAKGGAVENMCAEAYNKSFDVYQTVSGVPAGFYKVYCQGFFRYGFAGNAQDNYGSEDMSLFPILYANDSEAPLQAVLNEETLQAIQSNGITAGTWSDVTVNGSAYKIPNNMDAASACFTAGLYSTSLDVKVGETGAIRMGFKKTAGNNPDGNWTIFDNFEIYFYGIDVEAAKAAMAALQGEATALYDSPYLSAAAKSALENAVSDSNLSSAPKASEVASKSTALQNAIKEAEADIVVNRQAATLANPQPGDDLTFALVNPSFETGNMEGWTNNSENGMWTMMTRANATDPKVGNFWIEKYAVAGKLDISQTVTGLPAGHYQVSVVALDQASKTKLVANSSETAIVGGDKATYTVDIMLDGNTDLTLGLYCENHDASKWVGLDDFKLTFVSSDMPELPEAAEGKMDSAAEQAQADAIAAYNASKTTENYNAAVAAITAAQASVKKYADSKVALDAQKALMDNTNVYGADGFDAYKAAYDKALAAYNDGTLEEAVVNPNVATAWHASTDYNFLLTPWSIGGEPCNEFEKTLYINTWSVEGNTDGSNFTTPFFEYWIGDAESLGDNTISAKVEGLVPGLYEVTARVRVRATNGVNATEATGVSLYANDSEAVNVVNEAQQIGNSQFMINDEVSVLGNVVDGTLTIRFDIADANISWLSFKDVKYTWIKPATLPLEITAATGYNTFVAPCNIDLAGTGVKAYVVSEVSDAYVTLKEVEQIASGEAVILNGEVGKHEAGVVEKAAKADDNKLIGSTGVTATGSEYVLTAKDGKAVFAKVQAGVEIPAGKAYFVASSDAKFIAINGEETGIISNFIESLLSKIVAIYSVDGKAQKKLTKGINIIKMSDGTTQKLILE